MLLLNIYFLLELSFFFFERCFKICLYFIINIYFHLVTYMYKYNVIDFDTDEKWIFVRDSSLSVRFMFGITKYNAVFHYL